MSETTKTPRAHSELAARFMADSSLKCWSWVPPAKLWVENELPTWHYNLVYHVGHEKPTAPPKRKVTIAGITFDAPETEAPKVGAKYWVADVDLADHFEWRSHQIEWQWLTAGLVHDCYENASLHAQALNKLNRQLCGMENVQ